MGKRKQSKKHKIKNPPLCLLDKLLYAIWLIGILVVCFMPYILFDIIQSKIAYASSDVLAYEPTAAQLWSALPSLVLFLLLFLLWIDRVEERKPIVGPKHSIQKTKKEWLPQKKRSQAILCGIFLLLWIPAIGALFCRYELTPQEIRCYNFCNQVTDRYSLRETERIEFRIFYSSVKGSSGWEYSYTVYLNNGKNYYFMPQLDRLTEVNDLFVRYPQTSIGSENIDKLCKNKNYTAEERAIFEQIIEHASEMEE